MTSPSYHSRFNRLLGATAMVLAVSVAHAEPPRHNVLSFSVNATEEVAQDLLSVTLQVSREGSQATEVQSSLKRVMETSLDEVRAAIRGAAGIEIRTGAFSVQPRYNSVGRISGWQGSAQLTIEGTDTLRISQLVGKLTQLNVVNTQYGLSRLVRESREAALTSEAIQRFRSRGDEMARAFGFKGYSLGEVSVSFAEPGFQPRPYLMAVRAKSSELSDSPLPVEPGKGQVTVTVSGHIYLTP